MSTAPKVSPQLQIKFRVVSGPHAGQSFLSNKPQFTIGRGPENEVILLNDSQVSRQHARIQVIGQDIEIVNLSQKNAIIVGTEAVQKWKLTNDSIFKLGDSELQINFDLGQAVVQVQPQSQHLKLVPQNSSAPVKPQARKPQQALQKMQGAPAIRQHAPPQGQRMQPPQMRSQAVPGMHRAPPPGMPAGQQAGYQMPPPQFQTQAAPQNKGLLANPKARFYLILILLLGGGYYWLEGGKKTSAAKTEIKSTIKYSDEFAIKQNSEKEQELDRKREIQQQKNISPTQMRIKENFQKGMRDFQLGNYARAQDFFQVVLNLDSSHVLARRHLYLAQTRFDEVVKAKLILGESYYQKHNFKMCMSLYQQVMVMLEGRSNDQSFQRAQAMFKKCELASEGIK